MTTSRLTTSHTKKYEVTYFARYSLVWFCDLGRISSVGLAKAFMVATLILSLRLRIAEAGHLAVIRQNLSGGKAVPLRYIELFMHVNTHDQKNFWFGLSHDKYLKDTREI